MVTGMPRHTHPERERRRRRAARARANEREAPPKAPPKDRHRPDRCEECGTPRNLQALEATEHRSGHRRGPIRDPVSRTIVLCGPCSRDRSASWRWRWHLPGRELRDRQDRAA